MLLDAGAVAVGDAWSWWPRAYALGPGSPVLPIIAAIPTGGSLVAGNTCLVVNASDQESRGASCCVGAGRVPLEHL